MKKVFCPKCGNEHTHEGVFCNYCGANIESVFPESRKSQIPTISPLQRKIDSTFFCPKCRTENLRSNQECKTCGEDFSKYDLIDSSDEFARKRDRILPQMEEFKRKMPTKHEFIRTPWMIIGTIIGIAAIIFIILVIICFAAMMREM